MPQLAAGPSPVVRPWTKTPSMAIMARRPFLISLTLSTARSSGVAATLKKSRGPPGLMGSRPEKSEPENLPLKGTKPSGAGALPAR